MARLHSSNVDRRIYQNKFVDSKLVFKTSAGDLLLSFDGPSVGYRLDAFEVSELILWLQSWVDSRQPTVGDTVWWSGVRHTVIGRDEDLLWLKDSHGGSILVPVGEVQVDYDR